MFATIVVLYTGLQPCCLAKNKLFTYWLYVATGLEGGKTDEPAVFTVETRGAGQGGLGLAIEGPSKAQMSCKDNRDGSCTVEYMPTKPGDYEIVVKFAEKDIPGMS